MLKRLYTLQHSLETSRQWRFVFFTLNGWYPILILHHSSLQLLLKAGADPIARECAGNYALHGAAHSGNIQWYYTEDLGHLQTLNNSKQTTNSVECLTGLKMVSIDCENSDKATPLHVAARAGDLNLVRLFVSKGANVHAKGACWLLTWSRKFSFLTLSR